MSTVVKLQAENKEKRKRIAKKMKLKLKGEDMEIVTALEDLKKELDFLYNSFNYLTEPVLVDSCIYQLQSIHMRYQYYLNLCKEKGLVANGLVLDQSWDKYNQDVRRG